MTWRRDKARARVEKKVGQVCNLSGRGRAAEAAGTFEEAKRTGLKPVPLSGHLRAPTQTRGGGMDGLSDRPSKRETNQGKLRICAGGAMSLVSATSTASNFFTDFAASGLESSFYVF
jgi:hypothetical protein